MTELDIIYDFTRVCANQVDARTAMTQHKTIECDDFVHQQAYIVLDELLIAGEQQECSAMEVLRIVDNQDEVHKSELLDLASQTIVPIPKI